MSSNHNMSTSLSDEKADVEKGSESDVPHYVVDEEVRPEDVIVSRYGRFGSLLHRLFSMGVEARGVSLPLPCSCHSQSIIVLTCISFAL